MTVKRRAKTSEPSAAEIGGKVQLVAFFNCSGMIYQHICPPRQRNNDEYYTILLKQMIVHIHRKCPEPMNNWVLHRNNAPSFKARCNTEFLEKHNTEVKEHPKPLPPPTVQTLSSNFWLFLALKKALRLAIHLSQNMRKHL